MFLDEITVAYQPIVSLPTREVVAHEALLRWRDQHRPHSQLAARLEDLEAGGDIGSVSLFVLETAGLDWPGLGGDLHVNISARDLDDPAVLARAATVAGSAAARAGSLVLEVTEHQPLREGRGLSERLARLRASSVRFALDDFGTGWANMRSLQVLQPELVKIDRRLLGPHDDLFVIEWVLALARNVGADVCVEGVEGEGLAMRLRQLGVPMAQGFAFGEAAAVA